MPKLSALQWILFAVFLLFYGFAVFAVTRDYYLRNPLLTAAVDASAARAPHGLPKASPPTWIERRMRGDEQPVITPTGTDPALLNEQGDALFAEKRYREAIQFYRRVLELEGDDIDAHNDLGLALHYAGESQEALEILKAGTDKAPQFQRIWLTLGFVSANAGDREAAKTALEKARALNPENGIGQEATRLLGLLEGG
jgi:tetratricopeptide (TPR) repeat protein